MKKNISVTIILVLCTLISSTLLWMMFTWNSMDMGMLVYQLRVSIKGTDSNIIKSGILSIGIPTLIAILLCIFLFKFCKDNEKIEKFRKVLIVFGLVSTVYITVLVVVHYNMVTDFKNAFSKSKLVDNNYVKPQIKKLKFPEKKRNLIYIYLESMENTYADKKSGGAFRDNYIKELTDLSFEGENFSGKKNELNGYKPLLYSTWTMGGIFANCSGLPLKMDMYANNIRSKEDFFKDVMTLGDILEEKGYYQEYIGGAMASFAGKLFYLQEHGNYVVHDYKYAVEKKYIKKGYWTTWGYDDKILMKIAKDRLSDISKKDKPFNFTMLTMDTHFEDGYKCEDCPTTYGDNQYANAIACSSKRVKEFIDWIKKQDFYENTTVILVGDHLTMDSDFLNGIDENFNRTAYVNIINAPVKPKINQWRKYSTMDMFPTTLAALGVEIKDDRLALGTNLFSDKKTLLEKHSENYINNELKKQSDCLEKVMK